MSDDDYGFYGKGLDGYVHYTQGVEEAEKGSSGGGPKKSGDGSTTKGCIAIIVIAVLIYCIIKTLLE